MNHKIIAYVKHLQDVGEGEPWFGRSLFEILEEVDRAKVYLYPAKKEHSMIEILYHMITWLSFTEQRLLGKKDTDPKAFEKMDWRKIDPEIHDWDEGLSELRSVYQNIIDLLKQKDDNDLEKKVDYRDYNFEYLITGVTEHTIYHLGQIAYLSKLLS